jgi:3-phenylpropionate/trans-cinnamate dioxygenase ferredoxin subunit
MGYSMTIANTTEIAENELAAFDVDGTRIAVANVGGVFHAFDDTCTHLQCSLADGHLEGTVVTCPCHGSRFDVTSGEVLRGPAQKAVQTYAAHVEHQTLQVELSPRPAESRSHA